MARWAGCAAGLQIAPLFETIAALSAAPEINPHAITAESPTFSTLAAAVLIGLKAMMQESPNTLALWTPKTVRTELEDNESLPAP